MEEVKRFKDKYSFEERVSKVKSYQQTDPDKIIVIVEKHPKSRLPDLTNSRFLTFKTFKYAQVKAMIQRRIRERLGKEKEAKDSYFLYIGKQMPNPDEQMQKIYEKYKQQDGVLYIIYQEQQAF